MIWLTWRQFRVQFLVVASVIVAAAIILAFTGPGLADDYRRLTTQFIQNLGFQRLNPCCTSSVRCCCTPHHR